MDRADALLDVVEDGANSQLENARLCPFSTTLRLSTGQNKSQTASEEIRRTAGRRSLTFMMLGNGGDSL